MAARTMTYRLLGPSGVRVSEIGLGTMNFNQSNKEEAFQVFSEFVKAGGNFIDTANVYHAGQSEEVVGEWLTINKAEIPREKLVIATKAYFAGGRSDPNATGLSAMHLRQELKTSLARLQTDYVDLYQIHNFDACTPVSEWIQTFNDFIREGTIRNYGVCNVTGWQLQKIISTAKAMNLRGPVSVQNQYNLLSRHVEWEVLHCAAANGIAMLPWSPLKGGWLTGRFRKDEVPDPNTRVGQVTAGLKKKLQSSPDYAMFANDKTWNLLASMDSVVSANENSSVAQVAIRWLLNRPAVQSVLVGPRTLKQALDCLASVKWELTSSQQQKLNELSALDIPYPYEMVWRACRPPAGRVDGNLWPRVNNGLANM